MPPRGKLTDEQKQEAFDNWKGTREYEVIEAFQKEKLKVDEIKRGGLELSDTDMSINLQPLLDSLFIMI